MTSVQPGPLSHAVKQKILTPAEGEKLVRLAQVQRELERGAFHFCPQMDIHMAMSDD